MSARLPVLPLAQIADDRAPEVAFAGLDTVWFQLTGTLCNIACRHCFITCGPKETRVPMMSRAQVRAAPAEARRAAAARAQFFEFARASGLAHPRVKFLPLLRIGREANRTHGYDAELDGLREPLDPAVEENLVCASSRLVTADGVMTCPI